MALLADYDQPRNCGGQRFHLRRDRQGGVSAAPISVSRAAHRDSQASPPRSSGVGGAALRGRSPEFEVAVPRDIAKISVGRQHREVVAEADLCQQRIDGADLNAATSAFVSQFGRVYMVAPVGNQQRQRGEPIEDLRAVPWSGEALQKLLKHKPGGQEFLAGFDGPDQFAWFVCRGGRVAPKSQRPDAGIDKEAQRRERAAL